MAIDIESLLSEVSAEVPCGKDLSYDPSFLALEAMLQTTSGGGVVAGVEEEAAEPNWREVCKESSKLLKSSKDLQIAVYLTSSLLKLEGVHGLRDGLALLHGLLERFWDNLYPQLPDDNDPLRRINILQSLSPASVDSYDRMKFKQRLAEVPLCNSVQMGKFSLRDIQTAKASDLSVINAAFQDTQEDELKATSLAVQESIEHLAAIVSVFAKRASQGQTPEFSGFRAVLEDIQKHVQEYLAKRGHGAPVDEGTVSTVGNKEKGSVSLSGEIRSAQEALLALDKVCQYFDRHEPSSPVPLLLRRAQRLVSKSFLEVIKDFCPDGMSQVKLIGGVRNGSDDNRPDE